MKKLFGIFSLSVLLFSTLAPAFTYANEAEEEAKQILTDTLDDTTNQFDEKNDVAEIEELNEDNKNTYSNEYIITYDLNGGYRSEDGSTEKKEIIYSTNEIGSTNRKTPSKLDTCTEGSKINMKCMFDGWYYTGLETKFTGYITQDTTVYAKRLPFEDKTITKNGKEIVIMDRNVGATSNDENSPDSYGNYYQRGNNYGFNFIGIATLKYGEKLSGGNIPEGYISNYYNPYWVTGGVTEENNINSWGGKYEKNSDYDRQGPCPYGYHVPYRDEFTSSLPSTTDGNIIKDELKLSFAGYHGGNLSGRGIGELGLYRSSKPSTWSIYSISVRADNVYLASINDPKYGTPIRCFKNSTTKIIEYETNGGNSEELINFTKRWWESQGVKLPNIERENSKFLGRYLTENFEESTKVTTNDITSENNVITLFAKFECNIGYIENEDGKSCERVKIILNGNGGKFNNNESNKNIEINIIENPINITRIAHTDNLTDEGNYKTGLTSESLCTNCTYANDSTTPKNMEIWGGSSEFIEIEGANEIRLKIKYGGSSYGSTPKAIGIFEGNHTDYEPSQSQHRIGYINQFPNYGTINEQNYVVEGNSISIVQSVGSPNYGWHAYVEGTGMEYIAQYNTGNFDDIEIPSNPGQEFLGWYEENSETPFNFENISNTKIITLYAQWKLLSEKVEETTTENVVYTNNTTVTVGNETTEEVLSGSSTLKLVSEEVKEQEVAKEEDKTTVKESEIKVTSDKKVEYEGGLEVYLEKTENVGTENESTGKVEGTIKFSAPIAVKIPISSEAEYVKVQVKHGDEDFGFKGLTLNPVNECNNGEAINDKYNGEDVEVKENNGEKYATIYTCSASTFVAYTVSQKPVEPQPSAGGGRVVNKTTEQEHNSADTEKTSAKENNSNDVKSNDTTNGVNNEGTSTTTTKTVKDFSNMKLTRGEVAVMTNILLEVFPQLIEGNQGLEDITKACSDYTDEKDFTKDEKKAITRLCKLSIMGIKAEDKTPLEGFMVNKDATNNEFNLVVNRAIENYNEKDFETVKEALKKLENDEESVVFGTLYDVFMGIKNIFNK